VLLVQERGVMAFMPAVNTILIPPNAVDTGTDCNVVSKEKRGNIVHACSYCSTVTSECYGYRDWQQYC